MDWLWAQLNPPVDGSHGKVLNWERRDAHCDKVALAAGKGEDTQEGPRAGRGGEVARTTKTKVESFQTEQNQYMERRD